MPLVLWNDSYSVHVTPCDQEHKQLLAVLNALHQAMSVGSGRTVMVPVIQELQKYTVTHFRNEEKLLEKSGYPALAAHRIEHDKFIAKVQQFQQDLEEGRASTVEVIQFLYNWLLTHIKHSDRSYGPYLNAQGIN